jgi:hypothetical protein
LIFPELQGILARKPATLMLLMFIAHRGFIYLSDAGEDVIALSGI